MANFVFNRSLGRVVEFYVRIDTNDPAASELVIMILATAGIESDAVLKDKDTFSDVVSGATNEVTNTGYAKKVLDDTVLTAFAPDDTNDRTDLDIPDQTWTAVAAGDGWNDFVTGYDPVGSQTMTDILPMTLHDFVVVPDGCLSSEAVVMLNDHPKPIRDVVPGDVAYALTTPVGMLIGTHKVLARKYSGKQKLYRLEADGKSVRATANHPFFSNGEWRRLDALQVGDLVAMAGAHPADEIRAVPVSAITADAVEDTWDIQIEGARNFFANGFLVHNSDITAQIAAAGFFRAS